MPSQREFRQRLESEILILDGAMGTMLQSLTKKIACIDEANLLHPELIRNVHCSYAEAGADIISTNTFGANRIKLDSYGLADVVIRLNSEAARLAKLAVNRIDGCWIAGCIGPTGKLIEPLGELSLELVYECFQEQVLALLEGGVDLLLMETFSDLKELRTAILAARDHTDLPIMASMAYDEDFITLTGTDPVTAGNVLESLGVDALGVNCSTGPGPMQEVLGRYATTTRCPLFVEPNAGLPRSEGGKIIYSVDPSMMADYGEKFVELGASIVGTCCGSTPEHTEHLKQRLHRLKPVNRTVDRMLRLSSRTHTVSIGWNQPFCVFGERINPTNKKDLTQDLLKGRI